MKRSLPRIIIGVVLAISLLDTSYFYRSSTLAGTLNTPRQTRAANKPSATKPGAKPAHKRGPVDARFTIEEFADFECGACGVVHPVMKQMEKEFGSRIVVVFREYPLTIHKNGLTAAQAAESAGLQGKFWEMHDLLFENQKVWHPLADVGPLYREYAKQIGLDIDKFERDMASEAVKYRISADQDRGTAIGVNSTPSAFFNGSEIPFETLVSVEKLREFIRAELSLVDTKRG